MYYGCCSDSVFATLKSQRQIHNVDTTTPNSQRCTNVTSMLDSKFTSQHIVDVVMLTPTQRCNCNVKFTTSFRRWCYNVAPTLHQLCEERKMWNIHGQIVIFPQLCLEVVKKFNSDMAFDWYAGSISDTKFSPLFPSHTLKVPKNCFRKV